MRQKTRPGCLSYVAGTTAFLMGCAALVGLDDTYTLRPNVDAGEASADATAAGNDADLDAGAFDTGACRGFSGLPTPATSSPAKCAADFGISADASCGNTKPFCNAAKTCARCANDGDCASTDGGARHYGKSCIMTAGVLQVPTAGVGACATPCNQDTDCPSAGWFCNTGCNGTPGYCIARYRSAIRIDLTKIPPQCATTFAARACQNGSGVLWGDYVRCGARDGEACTSFTSCISHACTGGVCGSPGGQCTDGAEACGSGTCAGCRCRAACASHTDCDLGNVCQLGECVPGCTRTRGCPANSGCSMDGLCLPCAPELRACGTQVTCSADTGTLCLPGLTCRSGVCAP